MDYTKTDCLHIDDFLMKYMDQTISPEEANLLKSHVDACDACKEAFLVYDSILDSFDKKTYEAPPGFETAVMEKIYALPANTLKNKIDGFVYVLWGTLSVLFGVGFLTAFNAKAILEWMASSSVFANYHELMAPVSNLSYTFLESIYINMTKALTFLEGAVTTYYPFMIIAAVLFVLVQVILMRWTSRKNHSTTLK